MIQETRCPQNATKAVARQAFRAGTICATAQASHSCTPQGPENQGGLGTL